MISIPRIQPRPHSRKPCAPRIPKHPERCNLFGTTGAAAVAINAARVTLGQPRRDLIDTLDLLALRLLRLGRVGLALAASARAVLAAIHVGRVCRCCPERYSRQGYQNLSHSNLHPEFSVAQVSRKRQRRRIPACVHARDQVWQRLSLMRFSPQEPLAPLRIVAARKRVRTMPKKRRIETAEQRHERRTENARKQGNADAAADEAADDMVRRSIEKHGA